MGKPARIFGLTAAFAGLVLASSTSVSASGLSPVAPRQAIRTIASTHAAAAPMKHVLTVHALPGAFLAKPGGYTIVFSVAVTAPALAQTFASLTCPVKKGVQTVPLDGGAEIVSSSVVANVNSSYPGSDGKSWDVYVNNGTSLSTTFNVYAVCAKKLKNYVQRVSVLEPNPAGTESGYFFVRPTGDVIIGGGALSTSGATSVNLGGDFPSGVNSWEIFVNNASGVDASVTIYQICATNTLERPVNRHQQQARRSRRPRPLLGCGPRQPTTVDSFLQDHCDGGRAAA